MLVRMHSYYSGCKILIHRLSCIIYSEMVYMKWGIIIIIYIHMCIILYVYYDHDNAYMFIDLKVPKEVS